MEAFVRDVGRAVDAADIHDQELVLVSVKELARQKKVAHPPKSIPASRGRRGRGVSNATSRPKHDEEDYQKLKTKLTTAFKVRVKERLDLLFKSMTSFLPFPRQSRAKTCGLTS